MQTQANAHAHTHTHYSLLKADMLVRWACEDFPPAHHQCPLHCIFWYRSISNTRLISLFPLLSPQTSKKAKRNTNNWRQTDSLRETSCGTDTSCADCCASKRSPCTEKQENRGGGFHTEILQLTFWLNVCKYKSSASKKKNRNQSKMAAFWRRDGGPGFYFHPSADSSPSPTHPQLPS